jgi:hypothetical protein
MQYVRRPRPEGFRPILSTPGSSRKILIREVVLNRQSTPISFTV